MPKGIPKNGINKGWLKKGHFTWNKGKKMATNSGRTWFKKGIVPHNIKPKVSIICQLCSKTIEVQPCFKNRKFCSTSCRSYFTFKILLHPFLGKKRPNMTGEKNSRWIKDRTKLVKNEKKHLDGRYREWMLSIKIRDNWKCRIADVNCDGRLEAHHILNWKEYPELRYQINNGITLCHAHHPKGRMNEAKLSPYLQSLVAEGK